MSGPDSDDFDRRLLDEYQKTIADRDRLQELVRYIDRQLGRFSPIHGTNRSVDLALDDIINAIRAGKAPK